VKDDYMQAETTRSEPPVTSGALKRFMNAAAHDWQASPAAIVLVSIVVPVGVVLGGLLAALWGKEAYKWYVQEDGFAENVQVIAFAAAALFSAVTAVRLRRQGKILVGSLFLILAVGLFWVAGEEISWGQRVFGIQTPTSLEGINRQGELNIHNIYTVEVMLRWAQFAGGVWATIMPLLVRWRPHLFVRYRGYVDYLIPHVILVLYFAPTMLWRGYRNLAPPPPDRYAFVVSEWSEVIELNLALGLALFMWYQLRRASGSTSISSPKRQRVAAG
jgi:hypothetical protein